MICVCTILCMLQKTASYDDIANINILFSIGDGFTKLNVDDPFDEDIYMQYLDRRDFAPQVHMEDMEIGKFLLYGEGI